MPSVIITDMSPGELLVAAVKRADIESSEIAELATSPFEPGETQLDRALLVARHAFALAEAWQVISTLASLGVQPSSSPQPSPSMSQQSSETSDAN